MAKHKIKTTFPSCPLFPHPNDTPLSLCFISSGTKVSKKTVLFFASSQNKLLWTSEFANICLDSPSSKRILTDEDGCIDVTDLGNRIGLIKRCWWILLNLLLASEEQKPLCCCVFVINPQPLLLRRTTEQQQRFHEICGNLVKTQRRVVGWWKRLCALKEEKPKMVQHN